jgi:hypothetical protein
MKLVDICTDLVGVGWQLLVFVGFFGVLGKVLFSCLLPFQETGTGSQL